MTPCPCNQYLHISLEGRSWATTRGNLLSLAQILDRLGEGKGKDHDLLGFAFLINLKRDKSLLGTRFRRGSNQIQIYLGRATSEDPVLTYIPRDISLICAIENLSLSCVSLESPISTGEFVGRVARNQRKTEIFLPLAFFLKGAIALLGSF